MVDFAYAIFAGLSRLRLLDALTWEVLTSSTVYLVLAFASSGAALASFVYPTSAYALRYN
eukprot:1141182-Amorphochlora_amoeboformis.AAC.1